MQQPPWMPIPIIIISIVAALLLLYFVVGSIVRYHKGMRHFPEVLPNYRCWCGLARGVLVVLTCGRYSSHGVQHGGAYSSSGGRRVFSSTLPSRPRQARDVTFEALQSDWDEEFTGEVEAAMQPSAAVTVRRPT
ncbi:hypothetical protein DQ04_03621050 [Trypanosoma grayi]|uniref:hypothetical protein n=1 Tax=Trypanosoma grayi TaxID=71804 RepID=UPI0004F42C87|nr:hypothetical protein DQ04_03621050 [Trypanosoma grayi]KEG10520.1 hypothetical protein DQ04_03621050 [Trypanosoma grayi]